jgi:hypothetical protein
MSVCIFIKGILKMDCSLEEESNRLISLFNELIESEECKGLNYQCLFAPVIGIINNKIALEKMCLLNTDGFGRIYKQHFIEKNNTFTLVDNPYESMCMELVMRKWQ